MSAWIDQIFNSAIAQRGGAFDVRYNRVEPVDWESCAVVLDGEAQLDVLMKGWR